MSAYLTKLLWPLLNPAALLLSVLVLAGLACWLRVLERLARPLLGIAALLLLLISVFPPGYWALRPLEDRFPQPVLPARIDGIVVLSGAEAPSLTAARGQPHLNGSAERLLAFAELARRYPEARLIFTGGGIPGLHGGGMESETAEAALAQTGLDMRRVTFERLARNTHENASLAKVIAQPKPGETWLLVTSATHMPRAVGCFRAQGWPVTAYPVDYATRGEAEPWLGFNPMHGLSSLNLATREWSGLLLYRLLGHTDSLFPAL